MEKKIYTDDSYLYDKSKKLVSDEVINETYVNDQANINEKRLLEEAIKISPIGGFGSKIPIIKKFEKIYRKKPIEYGLYTNKLGQYKRIVPGDKEQVRITGSDYQYYRSLTDRITCHNHPPNYEDETNFTGRQTEVYGSFSLADILSMIKDTEVESRVVDSKYTYVLQEPKIGWDKWLIEHPNYESEIEEYRKKIKEELYAKFESAFETLNTNDDEYTINDYIHGEVIHGANIEVSKEFKIPYARYNWSGFTIYIEDK